MGLGDVQAAESGGVGGNCREMLHLETVEERRTAAWKHLVLPGQFFATAICRGLGRANNIDFPGPWTSTQADLSGMPVCQERIEVRAFLRLFLGKQLFGSAEFRALGV
jgi:hypothetical protein